MSDERLRELERRWKETGAVEDEAAFLLERVRAGDLTREKLETAAHYCEHEAACLALGLPMPQHNVEVDAWLVALRDRQEGLALRAGIALARLVLPIWEEPYPDDPRPRLALQASEAVLAGSGRGELAGRAADHANDAAVETERRAGGASSAAACLSALADYASGAYGELLTVPECAREALGSDWDPTAVRSALRAELALWVLGRSGGEDLTHQAAPG